MIDDGEIIKGICKDLRKRVSYLKHFQSCRADENIMSHLDVLEKWLMIITEEWFNGAEE